MRRTFASAVMVLVIFVCPVRADDSIASAQQAMKDQGFYYGEITGRKDADTTAAIRRYQIRNGLKITGELDNETLRSLRVTGTSSSPSRRMPQERPMQNDSELRSDEPDSYEPTEQSHAPSPSVPEPYRYRQEIYGIFNGTPYERASVDVQQRIIFGAQIFLARRGLYRSDIDGIFGAGTEFALRAFQSQYGLPVTGRFDVLTLRALHLMPTQRGPARRFPPRYYPRPVYRGQWLPG